MIGKREMSLSSEKMCLVNLKVRGVKKGMGEMSLSLSLSVSLSSEKMYLVNLKVRRG